MFHRARPIPHNYLSQMGHSTSAKITLSLRQQQILLGLLLCCAFYTRTTNWSGTFAGDQVFRLE